MKKMPTHPSQSWTIATIIMIAVAVTAGYAFGMYSQANTTTTKTENQEMVLFVVRGTATVSEETLTLTNPEVEWFTNHPDRQASTLSAEEFLAEWNQSDFVSDPPNAALADGENVVELQSPRLSNGSLTFDYVDIRGALETGRAGEVSLFIDAFPTAVNSQITD